MVDLDVITKVLRKFLTAPRNPRYLEKPEYKHMQERNKEIYLSSCWYKSHWSWKRVLSYFKNMSEGKKYFICGLPYQLSISEGLLMEDQVRDEMSEDDFDPVAWSKRKLLPLVVMLMKNSVNPLTKGCEYGI